MQVLNEAWTNSTSAKRKADYDSFMAKLPKVADGGGTTAVPDAPPPEQPQPVPVTADEQKMFQEMYAGAGLDAGTMKILSDGWANSTSAKRKADYDSFMAKLPKAADGGAVATGTPPPVAAPSDPVTADEQKMFQEMYGNAGLDAGTMKVVSDAWRNSTSAKRKFRLRRFDGQDPARRGERGCHLRSDRLPG